MHLTSGPSHNEYFSILQGLGLFAARDIEKQSMVIEYNGTILRNEVALMKENSYRSQVKNWLLLFLKLIWVQKQAG